MIEGRYLVWANKDALTTRTGPPLMVMDRTTGASWPCEEFYTEGPSWLCNAMTQQHPLSPTMVWMETDGPVTWR